jgi:hypothetical protein
VTISQARRQSNLLNTGFLDLLAKDSRKGVDVRDPVYSLSEVSDTLIYLAGKYIEMAQEKLSNRDHVASGALSASMIMSKVAVMGKVYSIEVSLADYYKFVDKGVKGWADEKGSGSPYSFKTKFVSKKMMESVRKWIIREGLKGRGKENKKGFGRRDVKRSKITDTSTAAAYAISYNIKKKGLRGSNFWSDTHKEMTQIVKDELGKALKVDIINIITNGNSN